MFEGYSPETIDFMWGIRFNNDREWFTPRKEIYTRTLLNPTKELANQVYDWFQAEYPDLPVICKVSRIYRDARRLFGRGPYKDHLWFSIRTGDKDWTGRPTFFFEITPESYSYGMGFWEPEAIAMECYRKAIQDRPEELEKLVKQFNKQEHFCLTGDIYSKSKGQVSDLLKPWYQRKSITLIHERPIEERVFSPELAQDMITGFQSLMPFYFWFEKVLASVPEAKARKAAERKEK